MRAVLLCVLLLGGCAGTTRVEFPPGPADRSLFIVPQGWHTGIAVRLDDIPEALVPEKRDFPGVDWLEFGWGDRDFYMDDSPGPWLALKAALFPTASVVNVVGVHGALSTHFPGSEIVEIRVSRTALQRMLRYLHEAFLREGPAAPSLGGGFYPGRESFHLLRTCNVWSARALRTAGLPVADALTRAGVMRQVRPLGTSPSSAVLQDETQRRNQSVGR